MKKLIFIFIFVLLLSNVAADFIGKGTVIAPPGINLTAEIGKNMTVSYLEVYSNGFALNISNFLPNLTFYVDSNSVINITSMNISQNLTTMLIKGSDTVVNFSVTGLPANTTAIYNSQVVEYATDGVFSINITSTQRILKLRQTGVYFIVVYDEETDRQITSDINLEVRGDSYNANYTIPAGTINLTDLPLGEYTLTYGGGQYRHRSYFITTNYDLQTLALFTVKNDTSALILFDISNEKGEPMYGATLKAYRFFTERNAWLPVEMEKVDINGQTGMYLVPYTAYYRFYVEDSGGTIRFQGDDQKVYAANIQIMAQTMENILLSMKVFKDLTTSLTFDNATHIVSFYWNDASNVVREGCVKVTQRSLRGQTTYGPNCISSSTATVTLNMSAYFKNDTSYIAYGYVETNTTNSQYFTDLLEFISSRSKEKFGKAGLFLSTIFVVTAFFIGLPINFGVAIAYTTLSMLVIALMQISFISWTLIITVTIIGIIIAMVNKT